MKKPILVLCCAIVCIAACSKKNSPAAVTPVTQADTTTADTSDISVDTSTHITVWKYNGTERLISNFQYPRIDTIYPKSVTVTIFVKGNDTTVSFDGINFKGWRKTYSGYNSYYVFFMELIP